ncbi:MAG: hypothetical protein IKP36_11710 [Bacteroidaceae bacterium]|nr:hypothetical protein [Bacteroidaceae bacterium]
MRLLMCAVVFCALCPVANAQITIGGNIYGGGNKGNVGGCTSVTLRSGDIGVRPDREDTENPLESPRGKVFGGARMANVGGSTFVHIDGKNAIGYVLANQVFGGNDIAGTIGTAKAVGETVPEGLTDVVGTAFVTEDGVDDTWNSYVLVSCKTDGSGAEAGDAKKVSAGQLYAGGNGDYDYLLPDEEDDRHRIYDKSGNLVASNTTGFSRPEVDKTYLVVNGGTFGYVYGGGNNATVKEETVIHMENPSTPYGSLYVDADGQEVAEDAEGEKFNLLNNGRFMDMGIAISPIFGDVHPSSTDFQIGRFFGGNNRADMAIRPKWNLQKGSIRNLYSGGNMGRMIYKNGLLLEINPDPANSASLIINNVYGGCRMADVRPMEWNETAQEYVDVKGVNPGEFAPYSFPRNLAARVIVAGGDINNVYGGNDVRGRVYFGNAVGVMTSIRGDIYGGGNGAYPYTDNESLEGDATYGDVFYNHENVTSLQALNDLRPNAEQVSIVLRGTADKKTIIGGSVYVGGNCATLKTDPLHASLDNYPLAELKMGAHVIADNVYLGNDGEGMVRSDILQYYGGEVVDNFSSLDLTESTQMADYMEGVSLNLHPQLVVESKKRGDRFDYTLDNPYTSFIGSLYYGGNRGSMTYEGTLNINLHEPIYIYNKVVGGCNNANVAQTSLNARFEGGILGSPDETIYTDDDTSEGNIRDRVVMNLSKARILPMRLNSTKTGLEWNTYNKDGEGNYVPETLASTILPDETLPTVTLSTRTTDGDDDEDKTRRLFGGNVYGGCCESGHVNGNVVINLKGTLHDRHDIFDAFTGEEEGDDILYEFDEYDITRRHSGVILNEQGMDVLGDALNVYGGGKGAETQVWGSATVNIQKGYTFQVFGGSESGVIGKGIWNESLGKYDYPSVADEKYGTYVNLNCETEGVSRAEDSTEEMADVEFIYGGGNEGLIVGSTHVNLDNGRLFNLFAGSSNADILGHTETYVGLAGFPYLRDHIYGSNDLGGHILGSADFSDRVRDYATTKTKIHGYDEENPDAALAVLNASAYVEYQKGRLKDIFGGCFGDYDYDKEYTSAKGFAHPEMNNAFVNFRPVEHPRNETSKIFGAGEGFGTGKDFPGYRDGDKSQDRSYVLVDITNNKGRFASTEVFGGGMNNGLGMRYTKDETLAPSFDLDRASAIIDLVNGQIGAAYGGSYEEGITRRSVVNVPEGSTINIGSIFGGAYGTQTLPPCDVYESHVNYRSEDATVRNAIYGGNNNERRTVYAHVNISSTVWQDREKGYWATIYGAGRGEDTWAEYTEVNLERGANVYEVYGGGENGHVVNTESIVKYMQNHWGDQGCASVSDPKWIDAWTLGDYYTPDPAAAGGLFSDYLDNSYTNLNNSRVVRTAEMDDRDYSAYSEPEKAKRQYRYNTNVIINEGAYVGNYAYGGGLGNTGTLRPGDIWGSTYIALLGGEVKKDIYAAGTVGGVGDFFGRAGAYDADTNPGGFTASANAYIQGGTVRNVYGGGWRGSVGLHDGTIDSSPADDIPAETHVVIGDTAGTSFTNGIPAVKRNAYGGGEGGAVYGTAYLTLNNGYVGYVHLNANEKQDEVTGQIVADPGAVERYDEKIIDETYTDSETGLYAPNQNLTDAGCLFGGGYIDNSSVDKTRVNIYGGHVRNSAFGGGEIAAIGRGAITLTPSGDKVVRTLSGLYRPGKTRIEMYGGQVHRNVFGGGRGYDNLSRRGSLNSDGYVFGQTEVHIHGGEIGTVSGVADGDGNVFGGGDVGFVYSAYENPDGSFGKGVKDGERYGNEYQGYYYQHDWSGGDFVTVLVDRDGDGLADEDDEGNPITERQFTEDCKVLIEPHMRAIDNVTVNGHDYTAGQFVPIADLNTLRNKNDYDKETGTGDSLIWVKLDPAGIIIHNAVFAGGNTMPGSTSNNANTTSVYGNVTASIHDIFHRDMITMGTRHTGGLYGDGNLTLVDGYRELNITNYGTDYYSIAKEIKIDQYHALPSREAAYYELKYTCLKDCQDKDLTNYKAAVTDGVNNTKASTLTADELQNLFVTYDDEKEKYVSVTDKNGVAILEYDAEHGEWIPNPVAGYWEESGVLPVYAGRLMNSIQRADFCGVYGSRMVMQGAQDRVPEEADYTNYTINRVREVSLNKKMSTAGDDVLHGNYFGIYNIVNYLGALTSDVDFGDTRTTDNPDTGTYGPEITGHEGDVPIYAGDDLTYYDWKGKHIKDRTRNNGSSHNKVALASGVYLELTTEESTGTDLYEKVWGPITGVIELDLINVSPGIGGGFVYAKNEHGVRTRSGHVNTTLTELNRGAVTKWDYDYSTTEDATNQKEWETSGNFVHSTQTIIDDCYNISNRYMGAGKMPAHYWYIKGSVYVYDQYISAYTGIPNAYSETVDIPLTITAASHGTLQLLNVMPSRYAYYASPGVPLETGKKVVINDKTYYKNDPISYWDWFLLSRSEKDLFVPETYVNCMPMRIDGGDLYEAGTYIMTKDEYDDFGDHTYTDVDGNVITKADKSDADTEYIFRSSNNLSHDTGYILTYEVNNPSIWDNWYTPKTGDYRDKINTETYKNLALLTDDSGETIVYGKDAYEDGPTYRLKDELTEGTVLGQRMYKEGDLISEQTEATYQTIAEGKRPSGQATFEKAYIVTKKITVPEGTGERHYNIGATVPETFAGSYSGSVEEAYICTNTVMLSKTDFIYKDTRMTKTKRDGYISDVTTDIRKIAPAGKISDERLEKINKIDDLTAAEEESLALTAEQRKNLKSLLALRKELKDNLVAAYYCTSAEGLYGGNYYESGKNYRGLEAWSSMSERDRQKFSFNYDALDLLIDPNFTNADGSGANSEGHKYKYDGNYTSEDAVRDADTGNAAGYSVLQSLDYTASYNSDTNLTLTSEITVTRNGVPTPTESVQKDDELTREVFEGLANEQRHYTPIAVKEAGTYYVVNTAFQVGSSPYAVGEIISADTYRGLPTSEQSNVTALTFSVPNETYYYCRDSYTMGYSVTPISSTTVPGAAGGLTDGKVLVGTLISQSNYDALPNDQRNFTIHGISPTETSTLYVNRESDIYDLSKEKIITVVYKYDYEETDASGNVTPISERHVVNIHLQFRSGVPTVENISKPDIILPGDFTSIREPNVTPGAYEVTGGGWELFETPRDAESHTNGIEYDPLNDPLYWYQHDWLVAYYAKTYLGRTYSNSVPVSVANYHDLADVMSDANKTHHMYIDNKNVKRDPKIYINDYSSISKNGLDELKRLFDLSTLDNPSVDENDIITTGDFTDHHTLNTQVRAGRNLEFFLRTDIDHSGSSWSPIGADDVVDDPSTENVDEGVAGKCFDGILHGDGHTIKGLDNSLFAHLCGDVYNLGVSGTFTGAGIAETGDGYLESCWMSTESADAKTSKPLFHNPIRLGGTRPYRIVNCYYEEDDDAANKYTNHSGSYGIPTPKPGQAFYNGEVAYDLNSFYLSKRYYHGTEQSTGKAYEFLSANADGTLPEEMSTGYYPTTGYAQYSDLGYVEGRFADGDYRYAAGRIPDAADIRQRIVTEKDDKGQDVERTVFAPIWPDDYIFFGQALNYGYDGLTHQPVPSAIVRSDGRIELGRAGNRVYRAPAYFRSKTMEVAHFNPYAVFASRMRNDGLKMTAIDFTDVKYGAYETYKAYGVGAVDGSSDGLPTMFYPPLLDDDGLTGILNADLTKNLLVYTHTAPDGASTTAAEKTASVVRDYLFDPVYSESDEGYRRVAAHVSAGINGHWVEEGKATNDHLLVDRQDFNAPISYTFASGKRMWYQRLPEDNEFVGRTKGWQGISLPFTAELVTTNQKGEITHFYSGSNVSQNGTNTKIGHEYWLRDFQSIAASGETGVYTANFTYPTSKLTDEDKTVTNSFLWDYYYNASGGHDHKDKNADDYQTYYKPNGVGVVNEFEKYPLLSSGTPYLIGFPGATYYEFDLSGNFTATTTALPNPEEISKQTITFASKEGTTIEVSDDEITAARTIATKSGYTYEPTYMSQSIETGTETFTLSSDGDSYKKVPATGEAIQVDAFRPYFTAAGGGDVKGYRADTRAIVFSNETSQMIGQEGEEEEDDISRPGELFIRAKKSRIVVTSTLAEEKEIVIVSASGATIDRYTIQPGKTIETFIHIPGVYIVNNKKLSVW